MKKIITILKKRHNYSDWFICSYFYYNNIYIILIQRNEPTVTIIGDYIFFLNNFSITTAKSPKIYKF